MTAQQTTKKTHFLCITPFKFVFSILILAIFIFNSEAKPATFEFFDIDGNILYDSRETSQGERKSNQPGFWTYWKLRLVNGVSSGLGVSYLEANNFRDLPDTILVNRQEFDQIRGQLAPPDGLITGDLTEFQLMEDPILEKTLKYYPERAIESFVPGLYRVTYDTTFDNHRDIKIKGQYPLVIDYKLALERSKKSNQHSWKGPAFRNFVSALERMHLGNNGSGPVTRVTILSDRDSPESIKQWLLQMHKDGHIPNPMITVKGKKVLGVDIISTTDLLSRRYAEHVDHKNKKAKVIAQAFRSIERSSFPKTSVLSPDLNEAQEGIRKPSHTVIFYENDSNYSNAFLTRAKRLAGQYIGSGIKILHFFSGPKNKLTSISSKIGLDSPSRWTVVTPVGAGFREPLPREVSVFSKVSSNCEKSLNKSKKGSK